MLKKLLFAIALTTYGAISAQTTVIDPTGDGGFENGADFTANGWTLENGPTLPPISPYTTWSYWALNTAAASPTGSSAYITNNLSAPTPPYSYGVLELQNNFGPKIYRDVIFPAGENDITLNFDWKGEGDGEDYLRVWLVPGGSAISYNGITTTAPAGSVQLGIDYNSQTTWTNTTITIPGAYAGTTAQLVFEWRNNDTSTGSTPAAVDNISLVTEFIAVYCTPSSSGTSYWIEDFYTNVGGTALDISNLGSGLGASGYEDNTATEIVEQFPGGVVDFIAEFQGAINTYGFNIWVDFNNNGVFTDAGEKVYASGAYVTEVDADFTVPPATTPGDYRMRIRANYNSIDPDSCNAISNGEAEDYTLRVASTTCTNDPSAITVSAIDFTTATISWTAASPIPGIGYEYFATTNTNVPLANQIATGTTNNVTTTANLTGLADGTTYYVWVRSLCDASFGGTGNWFGPEPFTTLVLPPTTTDVSLCPGDLGPNYLTATSSACAAAANLGTQLNGTMDAATDPIAAQPDLPILGGGSSATCAFKAQTSNYSTIDFSVDVTGSYTFTMDPPTPNFDAMAYIVVNDGTFIPGSCATGTWILGDDDSGPNLEPELVVNLTAGINYTLITTKWATINTTHTGAYTWNIAGPGSLLGPIVGSMDWYTSASGGSSIFSGVDFDPVGVAGSGLADTNTTGIYTFWAACASSPSVRTPADFIIGKTWNGSVDSDWNNPNNWTPNGVPNDTDCVVIANTANTPVINTAIDGLGNRLIVQNGGILSQATGSTLTITDAVDVEAGGTYLIDDSASLVQINDVANTVNGTFSVARTATVIENDYVYWSSPVTAFNIENVSPGTPNGYKYEWVPTVTRPVIPPGPNDFGDWQSADTGAMSPGKGYAIKAPTGHGATPAPLTAVFTGTPNNGSIAQTIGKGNYTGPGYTYIPNGAASLNVTSDDDNWNFIGNPYPSALHLEDFLYHPSHSGQIDGTAYIWTHGTDIGANGQSFYEEYTYSYNVADYLAVNATGNSIPSPYKGFVASGQGFYVLMTDFSANATETVYFENYMRRADYRNDQFYRNSESSTEETTEINTETKHRIWLDFIEPSGTTNTTLIGYIDGATNEKDRSFDAKNANGAGLNLYSMIEDDAFLIQGRQTPFVNTDQVPLGLNITETGIQTIAINTLEGLFLDTEQEIYLEDTLTGITHNLNNAPYTFTSDAVGYVNDRFMLTYRASTLSVGDFDILNGIKVYEESETIVVTSTQETIASIEVYDMLGRTLFNKRSINSDRFTINNISPNNATLIVKVKLANGQQKITKMIF